MGAAKRNHETAAGWAYHDATKHSFQSVRDSVHFLDWPAEAAATIFFIADLNAVFGRFGNRGYRAAQIEFFSPHARGKSAIFKVAVGRSAKRRMEVVQAVT